MDFVNRSTTSAPWGLVTSAAARARLRERAGELKSDRAEAEAEHLSVASATAALERSQPRLTVRPPALTSRSQALRGAGAAPLGWPGES